MLKVGLFLTNYVGFITNYAAFKVTKTILSGITGPLRRVTDFGPNIF